MPHPLDGARLKVVRAEEHLKSLKREIGYYMDSHPYEFPPIENDGKQVTARPAVIHTDPPIGLACILGDCLGNLRASLDYVAWNVAVRFYDPRILKTRERSISFPFVETRKSFNTDSRTKVSPRTMLSRSGVPAPAIDLIESVQPYNAGYEPLGLLSFLVNRDKHRLPLFTIANVRTFGLAIIGRNTWVRALSNCSSISMALCAGGPGNALERPDQVKVEGEVTVFVTLKDIPMPNVAVDVTLEDIFKCVSNIIPRFDSWV